MLTSARSANLRMALKSSSRMAIVTSTVTLPNRSVRRFAPIALMRFPLCLATGSAGFAAHGRNAGGIQHRQRCRQQLRSRRQPARSASYCWPTLSRSAGRAQYSHRPCRINPAQTDRRPAICHGLGVFRSCRTPNPHRAVRRAAGAMQPRRTRRQRTRHYCLYAGHVCVPCLGERMMQPEFQCALHVAINPACPGYVQHAAVPRPSLRNIVLLVKA